MAPSANIVEIGSTAAFDNIVKAASPSQLVVMDFHAEWCGPCHAIAPVYAQLASKYSHVRFVKVDVDHQQELARRFKITAMPTFKFLKAGKEVDQLRGASPPQLSSLVAKHAGPAPAPTAAPAASSASTSSTPAAPADNSTSLLSSVTSSGLSCLNESNAHPLSSIVGSAHGPRGSSFLESDVDPELLISIPFNKSVKIKAISIFGGVCPSQAPKEIKLFINHNAMDFGDAETLTPAQEMTLTPEDVKGGKLDLRLVRFQNVRSLHILVKSNQEDEETTRIDSIDVYGTVGEAADKGPLPKHDHDH